MCVHGRESVREPCVCQRQREGKGAMCVCPPEEGVCPWQICYEDIHSCHRPNLLLSNTLKGSIQLKRVIMSAQHVLYVGTITISISKRCAMWTSHNMLCVSNATACGTVVHSTRYIIMGEVETDTDIEE